MTDLPFEPTIEVAMNTGPRPWVRIDCETCGRRVGRVGGEFEPHTLRDCVRELRDEIRGGA